MSENKNIPTETVRLKQDYEAQYRWYKAGSVFRPTGLRDGGNKIECVMVGNFEGKNQGYQMHKDGQIIWIDIDLFNEMLKLN